LRNVKAIPNGQKRTAAVGHSVTYLLTYIGAGEACLEVASAALASHGIELLELGC
jgi:hypothetical protein